MSRLIICLYWADILKDLIFNVKWSRLHKCLTEPLQVLQKNIQVPKYNLYSIMVYDVIDRIWTKCAI